MIGLQAKSWVHVRPCKVIVSSPARQATDAVYRSQARKLVSGIVAPTTGVSQGSACATMGLTMYLLDVAIRFLARWPLLQLTCHVDDAAPAAADKSFAK